MNSDETDLYDKLVTAYSSEDFTPEIAAARQEYESLVTPIRADEPSEGFILTCFHTWYLFDRVIDRWGRTPLQLALDNVGVELTREERELVAQWRESIHELYVIKGVSDEKIMLKKVAGREAFKADVGPYARLLQKNELLEARIFLFSKDPKPGIFSKNDVYHILPGICVHPATTRSFIDRSLKEMKEGGTIHPDRMRKFFFDLQKRRLKTLRYSNVDVGAIYAEKPLF